jgi:hypothetical protein
MLQTQQEANRKRDLELQFTIDGWYMSNARAVKAKEARKKAMKSSLTPKATAQIPSP